jgi:hypothetical protein
MQWTVPPSVEGLACWPLQLAERNREVHRCHLTENKDDLIDQINNPIGR